MTVNWTEFAAVYNYFSAANKCAVVGIIIGQFFNNLIKLEIEKADNTHFIGHSLGAHVAGHAGRTFYDITKNKIARITGLHTNIIIFLFINGYFTKYFDIHQFYGVFLQVWIHLVLDLNHLTSQRSRICLCFQMMLNL